MSEVGVIPEDWEVKTLGELSKIVRGGSPRPAGDPKYFNGNYIPWLTVAALTKIPKSLIYVSQTMDFLTEAGSKKSRTLESGTLILSNSGATLGVCKILSIKCCANDGIAALLDFNKNIDKLYVCYYLNTKTKQFREVVATGNGQPNLNTTLIGLTQIPLPPLPEQQAIASALSDVDALITALEQLITKKRNIKQGAMQQFLTGKKRLPGFSGEWEVKELNYLCNCINDGTHHTPKYVDDGVPFYSVENVTANNFSDTKFISQNAHNELIKRCKPEKGDILLTRIGTLGKTKLVDWDVNASIYVSLALLKVNDQIDKNYFYQYTKSWRFVKDIEKRSLLNAVPQKINMADIGNVRIKCPPTIEEQKAIAQILSDMDTEIESLEQKRNKYKAIKQGMMQELLTGKRRLLA